MNEARQVQDGGAIQTEFIVNELIRRLCIRTLRRDRKLSTPADQYRIARLKGMALTFGIGPVP
jgi:hypothetical protein